jgi:hypothetical protein
VTGLGVDTQRTAADPPFGDLGAGQLSVQVQPYPVCGPDAYADPWVTLWLAICCQSRSAATGNRSRNVTDNLCYLCP